MSLRGKKKKKSVSNLGKRKLELEGINEDEVPIIDLERRHLRSDSGII